MAAETPFAHKAFLALFDRRPSIMKDKHENSLCLLIMHLGWMLPWQRVVNLKFLPSTTTMPSYELTVTTMLCIRQLECMQGKMEVYALVHYT